MSKMGRIEVVMVSMDGLYGSMKMEMEVEGVSTGVVIVRNRWKMEEGLMSMTIQVKRVQN